jgi:hypothetical protein
VFVFGILTIYMAGMENIPPILKRTTPMCESSSAVTFKFTEEV